MAGGEHAIGVAIAAVAREPGLRLQRLVARAQRLGDQLGRRGHQRGAVEAGAGARQQPARGRLAVGAAPGPMRGFAVAIEFFAGEGLVHQAVTGRAVVQQADQRAPQGKPGDEALGAVDRVEHPDIVGILALRAEFLADHAMMGKNLRDQAPHGRFRAAIGLRDGVEHAAAGLVLHREGGAEEGHDRLTGDLGQPLNERNEIHRRHCAASPADSDCLVRAAEQTCHEQRAKASRARIRGRICCEREAIIRPKEERNRATKTRIRSGRSDKNYSISI